MNDFLKTWYPPYFFLKMRSTRNIIYHIFFVFKFLDDLNTKTWNALNSCCLHPKKLIDIFPNLAIIINVYPAIPVIICECEHFLNYPQSKNKFRSTTLEERLGYLSIFSVENRTVTEFSQEKVIKEYKAPKKIEEKYNRGGLGCKWI